MTRDEAKRILLLYRPGTADAADPEIAQALALARQDAELAQWLEQHDAQQEALRAHIRRIPVPPGLKEQIISERVSYVQRRFRRRSVAVAAGLAFLGLVVWCSAVLWKRPAANDNFAVYENRMIGAALRGYAMAFQSSDMAQIRSFLAKHEISGKYELPPGLEKITPTGCKIEHWQGAKVAMICFHSGHPLPTGGLNDLWLFVVDSGAVKDAPLADSPQFDKVNKLNTAAWTRGNTLYLLGSAADEQTIRAWF